MKIAGCVILYNPEDTVVHNINSYISSVERLYVIDNSLNSHENLFISFEQDLASKILYISNRENLGIAAALNQSAKLALEEGYEFLLTMDQDSFFEKNVCKSFIDLCDSKFKESPSIGLIAPSHHTFGADVKYENAISEEDYVMTSGNIINLTAYKKIGGYVNKLFIDYVDYVYCLNLRLNGYKILQQNSIPLIHNLGDTKIFHFFGRKIYFTNHNSIRRYYMTRNRLYMISLFPKRKKISFLLEIRYILGEMFKIWLFESEKAKKTLYIYRGLVDFLRKKYGPYSYQSS